VALLKEDMRDMLLRDITRVIKDWAYSFLNMGLLKLGLLCFGHWFLKTIFCLKRDPQDLNDKIFLIKK